MPNNSCIICLDDTKCLMDKCGTCTAHICAGCFIGYTSSDHARDRKQKIKCPGCRDPFNGALEQMSDIDVWHVAKYCSLLEEQGRQQVDFREMAAKACDLEVEIRNIQVHLICCAVTLMSTKKTVSLECDLYRAMDELQRKRRGLSSQLKAIEACKKFMRVQDKLARPKHPSCGIF